MNARSQTHTCYGVDVFSTYALVAVPSGVSYSLPLCKALDTFIALVLYVKVHVVPTCIAERHFSERESKRQGEGTKRDRRMLACEHPWVRSYFHGKRALRFAAPPASNKPAP